MPSALETLVKILKLEREQGYKNTAVIGGLSSFSEKWAGDAHTQARKAEHHLLVDELKVLLKQYESVENRVERHNDVVYMLDRIMGRIEPRPELRLLVEAYQPAPEAASVPAEEAGQQAAPETAERESHGPRQRDRDQQERDRKKKTPAKNKERSTASQPERGARRETHRDNKSSDGGAQFEDEGDAMMPAPRPIKQGEPPKILAKGDLDIPMKPRLARAPRKPRPTRTPEEALAMLERLAMPVENVKGIGPRIARLLEKLGVETVNDLLFFLPRRYDDYTSLDYISRLEPNRVVTVICTVRSVEVRVGKSGRRDFVISLDDGSATMPIFFFGQHFLVRQIRVGHQLVASGVTSIFRHQVQLVNPEWEHLDTDNLHTTGIVPIYSLTQGLGARALRRLMRNTINEWADKVPDYIPESTLDRAELGDLGWAIKNLHFPEGADHLHHARQRFIFDQLLTLQLAVLKNRRSWQSVPGQSLTITDEFIENFISAVFPYELTNAQQRAIADIRRDISLPTPMNRLLQGDVGSGKTAVALVTLAMAVANGKQAALMAPTGILAEQHYRNLSAMFDMMPGDQKPVVGLLTSSLSTTEREAIYNGLGDGSIDVIIGTHALIQQGVEFKDLAIAVIDEQHRFGVEQRGALRGKGTNPHILVMTATPIPRTLALTIYADLDLSILDEKPPGRQPIQTRIVLPVARERMYHFVETQLAEGRQVFMVYPLVEASEKIEAESAVEAFEALKKVFFRYKVGLLHGRMKPAEKDEIMAAFSNHEFDVMVTTSVAEVGVDIPNASVMVIEGANRFGLSQLHQFRGRVGRGEHASYCLLVSDSEMDEAQERLRAMESTNDGFVLAEIDWKMRGAGDLVGTRQSGRHALQLMGEMTPHLVELAQREARTIYEEDADLSKPEHHLLARRVDMLHNPDTDVS